MRYCCGSVYNIGVDDGLVCVHSRVPIFSRFIPDDKIVSINKPIRAINNQLKRKCFNEVWPYTHANFTGSYNLYLLIIKNSSSKEIFCPCFQQGIG